MYFVLSTELIFKLPGHVPSAFVYSNLVAVTPFVGAFITTDPLASRISATRFSPTTEYDRVFGEGLVLEDRQIALQERRALHVVPVPAIFIAVG